MGGGLRVFRPRVDRVVQAGMHADYPAAMRAAADTLVLEGQFEITARRSGLRARYGVRGMTISPDP